MTGPSDKVSLVYHILFPRNRFALSINPTSSKQAALISSIFLGLFLLSALIDDTWIMEGKSVGLLEHPTTLAFLLLNITAPIVFKKSVERLLVFIKKNDVTVNGYDADKYEDHFFKSVTLKTNLSRFIYSVVLAIGLICFAWNSFQNQAPEGLVGFDFWDSIHHTYGYWSTSAYKLYLWVFFLPSIIHIQVIILITLNKLLKDAEEEKFIQLKPFHQDRYGGIGNIIKIAIDPCIPLLIIGSLSVAAAFFVHGQLAATPIIGLAVMSVLFFVIYLVPSIRLHRIIRSEKKRQISEITDTQDTLLFSFKKDKQIGNLETINALTPVCQQVRSISNWPYINLLLKVTGFINLPLLISIGKEIYKSIEK